MPIVVALIKAMRPKQWAKNILLFAALFFDRQLRADNLEAVLHTLFGFVLFSLISSAVYIINDLADINADRLHARKRLRPIASGQLPQGAARAAAAMLIAVVFPFSYWLSPLFTVFILVYFVLNLGYSAWLKHIPIVDVLVLALFYVLRVVAGVVLIEVTRFSPWLYVSITFLALFIGVGKRRSELSQALALDPGVIHNQRPVLQGYTLPLLDQFITIVTTATILTYSLYTFAAPNLPENHVMMLTIPFVIYAIFRYLYLVQVKHSGEAPEEVLFTDRPLQMAIALWGLVVLAIFYFLPFFS